MGRFFFNGMMAKGACERSTEVAAKAHICPKDTDGKVTRVTVRKKSRRRWLETPDVGTEHHLSALDRIAELLFSDDSRSLCEAADPDHQRLIDVAPIGPWLAAAINPHCSPTKAL
jgi:hypothetical protein